MVQAIFTSGIRKVFWSSDVHVLNVTPDIFLCCRLFPPRPIQVILLKYSSYIDDDIVSVSLIYLFCLDYKMEENNHNINV